VVGDIATASAGDFDFAQDLGALFEDGDLAVRVCFGTSQGGEKARRAGSGDDDGSALGLRHQTLAPILASREYFPAPEMKRAT
jgi:hypothetical protein